MEHHGLLLEQADRIRESGILGQARLTRLFDFLVECSASGTVPKEAIIAIEVFDKTTDFDVSQDSTVRVYIHNLRRKLEQFYAGLGKNEPVRIGLPKGDYRLVVTVLDVAPTEAPPPPQRSRLRRTNWLSAALIALAVLTCLSAVGLDVFDRKHSASPAVPTNAIWLQMLQNGKPIVVVIGDYYIFGDTERTMNVKRLIREFSINSKTDLETYLQSNPALASQYMDVGLGYLPTSSAFALANILPILKLGEKQHLRVGLMSSIDAGTIKSANIVYIGLLSGLGSLQGIVFAGSRFQLGDSFDELVDQKTTRHYYSGAAEDAIGPSGLKADPTYRDYGFFSTFSGLSGNRIIIIAGTRDEGLRQVAETLSDPARLDQLSKLNARTPDFEAIFEVLGMNSLDMNGKLITTSPLDPSKIWSAR